jgi:hypothetical protein
MDSPTTSNRSFATCILFSFEERSLHAGWRLLGQVVLFALVAATSYFLLFPLVPEGKTFG